MWRFFISLLNGSEECSLRRLDIDNFKELNPDDDIMGVVDTDFKDTKDCFLSNLLNGSPKVTASGDCLRSALEKIVLTAFLKGLERGKSLSGEKEVDK